MKSKTIKKIVAILLVGVMMLTFVACASEPAATTDPVTAADAAPSTPTPTDPAELKSILDGKVVSFMTAQGKYEDEYSAMADKVFELYGCTVEFQIVPDNQFFPLLQVKLSTSEVPDIFEYNSPLQNIELGVVNNCIDLSDEPWVDRLINPEIGTDPDDGKIYSMPKNSKGSTISLFYNKQVFEDCGVTNTQPATYQEFLDILETIKTNGDGVTPFYQTNGASWTTQIFMTAGVPVMMGDEADQKFDDILTGTTPISTVSEYTEVLTLYKELIDAGYVNEDHLSVDYDTAAEAIGTGTAAMYLINDPFAMDVTSKYPELELGAMVIPYGDSETLSATRLVQGLFVPSAGEQTDVARAFLQAWSSKEVQDTFYQTKPGFPAMNDVDGGEPLESLTFLEDTYISTGKYAYQANDYLSFTSSLQPQLFSFYVEVATGQKEPLAAMESFEKVFVDYMQQQQVAGF